MAETYAGEKRQTLSNSLLGTILKVIFSLVFALIISIIIEIAGMNIWWKDEGINHSINMYEYELTQLKAGGGGVDISLYQYRFVEKMIAAHDSVIKKINVRGLVEWLGKPVSENDNAMRVIMRSGFVEIEDYIEASFNIAQVFSLRLAILVLSLPLFLIAFFVGVTDGLVERDLRRWGAGRESSTMFDLAKATIAPLAIGAWMIYLSMPISINPSYIIIPFVFLFGMSVRVTTDRLKKYF